MQVISLKSESGTSIVGNSPQTTGSKTTVGWFRRLFTHSRLFHRMAMTALQPVENKSESVMMWLDESATRWIGGLCTVSISKSLRRGIECNSDYVMKSNCLQGRILLTVNKYGKMYKLLRNVMLFWLWEMQKD